MATGRFGRNGEGIIELPLDDWLGLGAVDRSHNDEKVVAIGKLGEGDFVVLPKVHWSRGLKGLPGLVPAPGHGNELVSGGDSGKAIHLTPALVAGLGAQQRDSLCITVANGRYFIKALTCRELSSEMPGWVVIDEFQETQVVRWWSSNPDLSGISDGLLERMLTAAGALRYDPMPGLAKLRDASLLPAKRELLGVLVGEDDSRLSAYVADLLGKQAENGSWQDSAVTTAGDMIRLLQSGVPPEDEAIQRGVAWLEQSAEPVGMPGLFLYDQDRGEEYNRRKTAGTPLLDVPGKKQRAFFDKLSQQYFAPFLDLLPKTGKACEPHTTWPTALALQALLRCHRGDCPRVIQAIGTLLRYRSHSSDCGGWCGCGIFGTTLAERRIDPSCGVDFDSVKTPGSNRDLEFATWFMTKAAVRSIVCNPYAENYTCLGLGDNMGLLVRNRLSSPSSSCTTVLQGALALHPGYHGTRLEELAAYEMSGMQNPNGDWPSHRISGMLHFVSLFEHPLGRFLAYRSLPGLIRRQKENGLWFSDEQTESVDDLLIVSALKRLGILSRLIPVGTR
jgi:hypothetical protein